MKIRVCRMVLSSFLATGLMLGAGAAFAQDAPPPPPDAAGQGPGGGPGGGHMGRGPMNPDEQLQRMTKRYNLSSDQQGQIKPILADEQQQMQALRGGDGSMSREDRMAKMQSIRQGSSTKIAAVLNDSQKQKFTEDQQKMQERMQQRMQGGGGPPQQ
jgi:protein CpxP